MGSAGAMETATETCRLGDTVRYIGAPFGIVGESLDILGLFQDNITLQGSVAPVRAYIDELMQDMLQEILDPLPIFTKIVELDRVPEGYQAMNEREAIKVLVTP